MRRDLRSMPRRSLLAGGAATLATAGLATLPRGAPAQATAGVPAAVAEPAATPTPPSTAKPLPPYASWKDAGALIVHSSNTIETRRSAFGTSVITPAERLYIRNNLPPPDAAIVADRDAWEVAVEGVKNPRSLSVRELKAIGIETTAMVLQCSGNGRGYFPSKPSGTPWQVGAAGCVIWSGAPVRMVVDVLGGVAEGARFMTGTGGEKLPDGIDAKSVIVERSVPVMNRMPSARPPSASATTRTGAPLQITQPAAPTVHLVPLGLSAK